MIAQYDLTESEKEVDYYHQKFNERIASQVDKQIKT